MNRRLKRGTSVEADKDIPRSSLTLQEIDKTGNITRITDGTSSANRPSNYFLPSILRSEPGNPLDPEEEQKRCSVLYKRGDLPRTIKPDLMNGSHLSTDGRDIISQEPVDFEKSSEKKLVHSFSKEKHNTRRMSSNENNMRSTVQSDKKIVGIRGNFRKLPQMQSLSSSKKIDSDSDIESHSGIKKEKSLKSSAIKQMSIQQAKPDKSHSAELAKVNQKPKTLAKKELEIIKEKISKKELALKPKNLKDMNAGRFVLPKTIHILKHQDAQNNFRGQSAETKTLPAGAREFNHARKDKDQKVSSARAKQRNQVLEGNTIDHSLAGSNYAKIVVLKNAHARASPSKKRKTVAPLRDQLALEQSKRKHREEFMVFNLFNNWWLYFGNPKSTLRVNMGTGNNFSKVTSIFKKREQVDAVVNPNNANIVWTQQLCKTMRVTNIFNLQKVSMASIINQCPFYKPDAEYLTELIVNQQLFSVTDRSLVKSNFEKLISQETIMTISTEGLILGNHVRGLFYLTRKFVLGKTIVEYCSRNKLNPWNIVPLTFFLTTETYESDIFNLVREAKAIQERYALKFNSAWRPGQDYVVPMIVKPGEMSNRGKGIMIAYSEKELKTCCANLLSCKLKDCKAVVQEYLTSPLLFKSRKFDLRCYCLVTKYPDKLVVYWYKQGYARTSSYDYDQNDRKNLMVHLTNEAVQVQGKLF